MVSLTDMRTPRHPKENGHDDCSARPKGAFDHSCATNGKFLSLTQCEKIIRDRTQPFYVVGRAYSTIIAKQLYRRSHETWGEYCQARWGISRFQVYRLIRSSEVVEHLLPMGNIQLPTRERQVRPLISLDQSTVQRIWQEALKDAGHYRITFNDVIRAKARLASRSSLSGARSVSNSETSRLNNGCPGLDKGLHKTSSNSQLSKRERELVELAADGLSIKEMAQKLSRSERTIRAHFEHIYEKLRARNRAHAVAIHLRNQTLAIDVRKCASCGL